MRVCQGINKCNKGNRQVLILLAFIFVFAIPESYAIETKKGIDTLNIELINNLVLKGEVKTVLTMLDTIHLVRKQDKDYRNRFEKRFKYETDQTNYLDQIPQTLRSIFVVYQTYWRRCLLDNSQINDSLFKQTLISFFEKENALLHFTDLQFDEANLERIQKLYVTQKGFFVNDLGRTGFLYELLLWKDVTPTRYKVSLIDDTVQLKVNFIERFISLGWLGYARLGRGPGGWATDEALFCVSDLYKNRKDESFLVSYLKHEGQHFHDYKTFPNLPGKDLEYRGKIQEFYYSNEQLFKLIHSFIEGGKNDITNAHPFADYCIVRDMSRILFNMDYQTNIEAWKQIGVQRIHDAAKQLYTTNTEMLKKGSLLK